jgi:hypothetical protein
MQMFFGSVKKRSASSPPSRPTPLCFMPPTLPYELVSGVKHLHFSSWGTSSRHRGQEPLAGGKALYHDGRTFNGKLLVVVHTDRGDNIRIISARRATRRERKFYEEVESLAT